MCTLNSSSTATVKNDQPTRKVSSFLYRSLFGERCSRLVHYEMLLFLWICYFEACVISRRNCFLGPPIPYQNIESIVIATTGNFSVVSVRRKKSLGPTHYLMHSRKSQQLQCGTSQARTEYIIPALTAAASKDLDHHAHPANTHPGYPTIHCREKVCKAYQGAGQDSVVRCP